LQFFSFINLFLHGRLLFFYFDLPYIPAYCFYTPKKVLFLFFCKYNNKGVIMKNIIVKLVKIANDIDAMGMHNEADEITKIAEEMKEDGDREAAGMINLNTDTVQKQRTVNLNQKNINDSVKKVNTLKDF